MNEITTRTNQLPDTIEDLSQFVLVGKAKLNAYLIKLRTVNRLSDAQRIREQTFEEAQELANALIAAEQRIGEILLSIPKQSGGVNQYNKEEKSSRVEKSKSEVVADMGYSRDQVSDYQRMAQNPEVVKMVIDRAMENGEIVSRSAVMKEIKELNVAKKALQEQNDFLKKQVVEPQVVERVVEKEVIPPDYETAKRDAEIARSDFNKLRKQYDDMAEKWKRSEEEKRQIQAAWENEKNDPVKQTRESALIFCAGIANFIEKYGGYIWLTERLNDLPREEREGFERGINALKAWVMQMETNMKGETGGLSD